MAEHGSKRALGKGINSLFFEAGIEPADEPRTNEITKLPITKVEPRDDQPRREFDEQALAELADSISRYGVLQPLTVRAIEGGYYQIIAGERRWRAARIAGLFEVPVRVVEADDQRVAEIALVENLQREDLNPIEEARGYRTLMTEHGLSQEEVARSVGKSRPSITNALRLLNLDAQVLDMVERGTISAGHGRAILACQSPEAQQELAQRAAEQGLSVRQTEQLAARAAKEPTQTSRPDTPQPTVDYYKEAADRLGEAMGRRVKIVEGRRTGRIELEYYGPDDREALLDALSKVGRTRK